MTQSLRLQGIDQKIKDLQERKKHLENKQISDFGRLIRKVEAHTMPPKMLVGALLEIVEVFRGKQEKTGQWIKKGQDFLKSVKKTKGDEKDPLPSFLGTKESTTAAS